MLERGETRVLVQGTPRGDEVVLRARGPERKALLGVIASDLDALHASFSGLAGKVTKRVPCICDQCRASEGPEFYDEAQLLRRKEHGKQEIECPRSYDYVSVLELLDGLRLERRPHWAKEPARQRLKIFLASSEELREIRDEFELYFRRQNDSSPGPYLEIVRWENFLDAMSKTRMQDEYNIAVRACDVFVCLFRTRTGTFTEEEFDNAHDAFLKKGRPHIFTFFQDADVSTVDETKRSDLRSLWAFQDKLRRLGHYFTVFKNSEELTLKFRDQLDRL
jgi:hypothetical protein